MSATAGQIGYGFAISHATTLAGTYTALAEVTDIKPPKVTTENVKIQRNDSPDLFGEKIPGWKDASDCELTLVYAKTQTAAIYALQSTPLFWKFIKPDGTSTGAFYGFISEIGDETPLKDKMTNTVKITVSGAYAFTAGS